MTIFDHEMERAILSYIGAEREAKHVLSENDIHAVGTIVDWAREYKSESANVFLHVYIDNSLYYYDRVIDVNTSIIDELINREKEFVKGSNIKFEIIFIVDGMEKNFSVQLTKRISLCGIQKSTIKGIYNRQSIRGMSRDGRICP